MSRYPWKIEIVSTVFWVGETGSGANNTRSAWDPNWEGTYGGVDDPLRRNGFEPAGFRPLQNPFYAALPYFDMQAGRLKPEAPEVVPWFIERYLGKAEVLLAEDPGTFTRRNRHPRDRIPVRTYKNPKE